MLSSALRISSLTIFLFDLRILNIFPCTYCPVSPRTHGFLCYILESIPVLLPFSCIQIFDLLEWTQELSLWSVPLVFLLLILKIFFILSSFLLHISVYFCPWLSRIFQALLFYNQCHRLFHWVLLVSLFENNKTDCLGKDYLFYGSEKARRGKVDNNPLFNNN